MAARIRKLILHPIIFAVYPILALMAHNLRQISPNAGLRSLVVSVAAALILWGLLRLVFKSWSKAAVLVSLALVLFYSYGQVYDFLHHNPILGADLGRHRWLLTTWSLLFLLGLWLIVRKMRDGTQVTQMLNLVGLVLLIFPAYQFTAHAVRMEQVQTAPQAVSEIPYGLSLPPGPLPDIYYIILDGYPRQDVIEKWIGIDNTPFLDELRAMGFYVAECSQSNYAQTELSLASTFNFNYLDQLGDNFVPGNVDRYELLPLIHHSQARQILSSMGYEMVAFETGHPWIDVTDAEHYYSSVTRVLSADETWLSVNGFELMLINSSMGMVVTDTINRLAGEMADLEYPYKVARERVLYTLNMLNIVPTAVPGPKFVYAHIVSPHFPILFDAQGEYALVGMGEDDETYAQAYQGQLTYVNGRILAILNTIITVSPTPPIIILQSDHGFERHIEEDRTFNLAALYLPDGGDAGLYPQITPVNTFRIIFNTYFGGSFELLEDRAYFSDYPDPYNFVPVPNNCVP